jgi:hypothetical protein
MFAPAFKVVRAGATRVGDTPCIKSDMDMVRIGLIALNFGIELMASLTNLDNGSPSIVIFAPLEGLGRAVMAKGGFG